ncbi:CHAP domain-containing protein [Nocardia puris]|uniref:CHAP domain-containing protein n=1 Tax=Nocardia puris TaxID=208602 RepID=A0A366DRI9_9NOCA|nr:CHAP domain-containing protein [Nocardia puris]MBF6210823.1 CHAP domain-containing protein [Nocardia puris]MBF6364418.1 CHAP domain-containing protein [Nocardia puris]MBF6459347.1 CHAP domain-containing protein [Nocardia puris]RBO92693.1 CHAP domain-containing protein [Nocardia puris]
MSTRMRAGLWSALALAVVAGVVAVAVGWWLIGSDRPAVVGESPSSFPALDRSALDSSQSALVEVLEREYADPGAGTEYAEGVEEPWCADFVSWVMREAGRPLANPHSGSWRIPGVYTLQEYYQAQGRFVPIGADYQPRTGDVLLYGPDSQFTQHTNIVLAASGGEVTTIGGNEFGEVRLHRFTLSQVRDVVGIGRF